MATVGNTNLTYSDWAKRTDPSGKVSKIVESLSKMTPTVEDAIVVRGNLEDGHKTTVRSGLPQATWRMLNYGVQPTKSTTRQVIDRCGMLETYSQVDVALADLSEDLSAFRGSEDSAFLEGMSQQFETALFYGNETTNPEQFTGLAPRYSDLSAGNGDHIIDAGGTGSDNTSIWLVVWGDMTCHLTFPKGSKAGWTATNKGQETVRDSAGRMYEAYVTHYKWDVGLVLRDWRYVVRVANIDVSNLTADASSGANLIDLCTQAVERVQGLNGRPTFYMNRNTRTKLRQQIHNKSNVNLTVENPAGRKVMSFDDIPVHMTESLLDTESRVV